MPRVIVRLLCLVVLLGAHVAEASAADFNVQSSGQGAYLINGQANPTLTLTRGRTYTFDIAIPMGGHPFWIKTVQGTGTADSYDAGVVNNGASPGLVTFNVPANAPAQLYYQCQFHEPMTGLLNIVAPPAKVPAITGFSLGLLGASLGLLGFVALRKFRSSRPLPPLA